MRSIYLIFCGLFFINNFAFSQQPLQYFEYRSNKFISINLDNLVSMVNMPILSWENELKRNGFKDFGENKEDNLYLAGEFGEIFQGVSKDLIQNLVIIQWYDLVNKKSIVKEFEEEHKNKGYYMDNEMSACIYTINYQQTKYIIKVKSNSDVGFEEIIIQKQ